MGAKQSKRSVDISGKEAESAGEVAAAGAGGEGRVEQLADADALKPQINGDAHIHETSDKEKQLDSGTPENEKDATTEKEVKGDNGKENEMTVTNGESESKEENGETVAATEDTKKPKKEKVKKKWSLRSISFSRKDKPKQEKKAKEDEAKTPNGDQEKLAEEVAETSPQNIVNEVAEEVKSVSDAKDEKTPETPVTEPLTNGSNTPESPKVEPSSTIEPIPETPEDNNRPESKVLMPEPDQLPVNGLSLEETKVKAPEIAKNEESNEEKVVSEKSESVPAPEIPVQNEVCVEQMPIEPSPPPLPANPPPSSVASFAATTMAPELIDASLATTAEPVSENCNTDTKIDIIEKDYPKPNHLEADIEIAVCTQTCTEKETIEESSTSTDFQPVPEKVSSVTEVLNNIETDVISETRNDASLTFDTLSNSPTKVPDNVEIPEIIINESQDLQNVMLISNDSKHNPDDIDTSENLKSNDDKESSIDKFQIQNTESNIDNENLSNVVKDSDENIEKITQCNGEMEDEKSETEEQSPTVNILGDVIVDTGKITKPDHSEPLPLSEALESQADEESNDTSESFPLPPSELCRSEDASPPTTPTPAIASSQEVLAMSNKMADLIPEVPVVPELKTDMETSDVAVAN